MEISEGYNLNFDVVNKVIDSWYILQEYVLTSGLRTHSYQDAWYLRLRLSLEYAVGPQGDVYLLRPNPPAVFGGRYAMTAVWTTTPKPSVE